MLIPYTRIYDFTFKNGHQVISFLENRIDGKRYTGYVQHQHIYPKSNASSEMSRMEGKMLLQPKRLPEVNKK